MNINKKATHILEPLAGLAQHAEFRNTDIAFMPKSPTKNQKQKLLPALEDRISSTELKL